MCSFKIFYCFENTENIRNIFNIFEYSETKLFQGYTFISYNQADEIRKQVGSALVFRGLGKGSMVGISSQNTAEWTLLGLGCDIQSITMVPLYDTLGEEGVKYILNQTELTVLFAHPKTLKSYLSYLPETESVKLLVKLPSMDSRECTAEEIATAESRGVDLVTWEQFIQTGKDNPAEPNLPTPEDIITLCYTSGQWLILRFFYNSCRLILMLFEAPAQDFIRHTFRFLSIFTLVTFQERLASLKEQC